MPLNTYLNYWEEKIPEVSVVIPLYNKGSHIARTLKSVLSQTFEDFEVIVVDDGSVDNGAEIVRGFRDQRIRLIQQTNQGVSAARNRGIYEARADLIAFLDADDEWLPKHLETIIQLKNEFAEAGAFTTSYIIHDQKGQKHPPNYRAIPPSPWKGLLPDYFLSAALGDYPINSSVLCIKTDVFWEIGGYPIGVAYGEDADLWGKLALRYPIAFSWEIGAIYHKEAQNRACNRLCMLEKEPFILSGQDAIRNERIPNKENLLEYINKLELARAQRLIRAGNTIQAKEILSQCETKIFSQRKLKFYIMAVTPQWLFKGLWRLKRLISQAVNKTDYSEDPFFKS